MDQKAPFPIFPMYFRGLLLLAGMYTIAWSAFFKWYGSTLINWIAMGNSFSQELNPSWFGNFGLLVGLVLFVSSFYPVSWIKLILGGMVGKILLASWFAIFFLPGLGWNKRSAFLLIFNELLWIIPLVWIYIRALSVKHYFESIDEDSTSD
jgi:hypothetical protein